jgi:hypothetical protein
VFALDLDTSVDDEIRKNYNPSKIDDDALLPALPKITKESMESSDTKSVHSVPIAQKTTYKKNITSQSQKASLQYKNNVSIKPQVNPPVSYITLKQGTKIKVKLQTPISDKVRKGTKVSFISLYPVSTTYFTIPMGTIFKGEVVSSHKPQLSGNGGLIKIRVNSMLLNNQTQPLDAYVTKANYKKVFFNNIKGKRKYISNVFKSTRPGRHYFKKMLTVSANLAQDGSSIFVAPFSLALGVFALGGGIILSPVTALRYRGNSINIPENSMFEILGEDGYVKSMKLEVMELGEPDESGRRKPVATGQIVEMPIDTVIVALGTGPNPIIQKSAQSEGLQIETDRRGYIIVDCETNKTSIPTIFAGGDVAPTGESNAINAMGAGKKAAKAINELLK